MADVTCIRCGQTRGEIEGMPYGGKVGEELKAKVCNVCWKEWYDMSVKIINEYRLNLREPAAREFLATQMRIFFKMQEPPKENGIRIGEPPTH
ncbi:MAG: Fe(2+)-trafficking protein [Nitrospirae bacterium]|nr:Fe(2+)-trafficking protein [Candidatus Manganitrophaceae bacterium]